MVYELLIFIGHRFDYETPIEETVREVSYSMSLVTLICFSNQRCKLCMTLCKPAMYVISAWALATPTSVSDKYSAQIHLFTLVKMQSTLCKVSFTLYLGLRISGTLSIFRLRHQQQADTFYFNAKPLFFGISRGGTWNDTNTSSMFSQFHLNFFSH